MNDGKFNKEILKQRQDSYLQEILQEAFSMLDDRRLKNLNVTRVDCKKGKYDAVIFIESSSLSDEERREIKKAFKGAVGLISSTVLKLSQWYRCPNFSLEFDDSLCIHNKIENIFKKISSQNG